MTSPALTIKKQLQPQLNTRVPCEPQSLAPHREEEQGREVGVEHPVLGRGRVGYMHLVYLLPSLSFVGQQS